MTLPNVPAACDAVADACLWWLIDHLQHNFDCIRAFLLGCYELCNWPLQALPPYVVSAGFAAVAWRLLGWRSVVPTFLALMSCAVMGLWFETMSTLAEVVAATFLAMAVAVPLGILAGFSPRSDWIVQPGLNLLQTLPPYIYLLPAIALLGYGPATALVATVIVAIPPALRLTTFGIRSTPPAFIELGESSGVRYRDMFLKIRLPFAAASIMAGVNQSMMMAFGMVVVAGIVGSGGLGGAIYKAIRTLDIARSVDASIAIVILTIVLDRLTQNIYKPRIREKHV